MNGTRSLKLHDLNEHLVCALCEGYYIDATTIIECLHSFCRSCIVTYLATNRCCPKCEIPAHKTRPLLNIRSDKTLQDVVFKLVPDLFEKERERNEKFHLETGIPMDTVEKKNTSMEVSPEKLDRRVSLSLEYDNRDIALAENSLWKKENISFPKRYLRCFNGVTIGIINKLVRKKLAREDVEVLSFCRGELMPENYSLMDVANTFAMKSDRTMSLTFMTFTSKNRKRKILENVENEMKDTENVPAKKKVKESDFVTTKSTYITGGAAQFSENIAVSESIKGAVVAQPLSRQIEPKSRLLSSVINPKAILPKPKLPTTHPARLQTGSQNGGKNMSYSVMNVPLREVVAAPVAEKAMHVTRTPIPRNFTPMTSHNAVNGATTQGIIPQQLQGSERTKSINSIANRLQIQRQMQSGRSESEKPIHGEYNLSESAKVATHSTSPQVHSSWTPTGPLATAKLQRLNASGFQSSRKDEAESLDRYRQVMRPGTSGAQNSPPSRGMNQKFSPFSTSQATGKFIQLNHSREVPPNYNQATEQQRKMRLLQQARPKYQEIQPKVMSQRGQPQSQTQRAQKGSSMEDLQLLSTTRQLASLRQQQKILNEIAAAVAGRSNSSLRTSDSIRAAVSSLSPRMTSPRLSSYVQATKNITPRGGMSFSNVRPRFSLISPKKQSQNPQIRSKGNHIRPTKQNGATFSEISRLPANMGFSSLTNPRERNMEIYRNTIAKAKAEVREMNLKDKTYPTQRTVARTIAAPYNVPRSLPPRKIQQKVPPTRSPYSSPVPIAPKPTPVLSPRPSHIVNYRPPPAMRPQRMMTPIGGSPYNPNRQVFRPSPHTSHPRLPNIMSLPRLPSTQIKPPVNLPEQEQPLCLVVKK